MKVYESASDGLCLDSTGETEAYHDVVSGSVDLKCSSGLPALTY